MHWFPKFLRETVPLLLSVLFGWWLGLRSAEWTTDLQHRPAFIAESLALVVEFTAFYDQQSRDFSDVADLNHDSAIPRPRRKERAEEILKKLSDAKNRTVLLDLEATQYFHGTDWLEKFRYIHDIWSSAAEPTNKCYEELSQEEKASFDLIRQDLPDKLGEVSDQLSKETAELREQFYLALQNLPPESSFFQHSPTPTPTSDDLGWNK